MNKNAVVSPTRLKQRSRRSLAVKGPRSLVDHEETPKLSLVGRPQSRINEGCVPLKPVVTVVPNFDDLAAGHGRAAWASVLLGLTWTEHWWRQVATKFVSKNNTRNGKLLSIVCLCVQREPIQLQVWLKGCHTVLLQYSETTLSSGFSLASL